jgi:error-prone DNA polymerase
MGARLLCVQGKIQRSPEGVVHLVAERVIDRSAELQRLSEDDESQPQSRASHPRNLRIVPKSRDFH